MCGIAGVLQFDRQRPVDRGLLEAMAGVMAHRGPDDEGYYLADGVGLAHRRLSIIDRASGQQPLSNEDRTVWITYNGEIYNFEELRDGLAGKGHIFKTASDTEVIVHLYEEHGEGCVERLIGMFAFAIWDARRHTLLLARDRLGIKPLYYAAGPDRLVFASEIKALLRTGWVHPRLDFQALHDYLTFHYTIAPRTMLQGIAKLPPAHILIARDGTLTLRQYWDLDYSPKAAMTEEACVEEFYRRLRATVRSHLVGEVPIGVLLSGGLDSTAVTGLVAELTGRKVKTFSVGFEGQGADYDERPYARLAARHYGAEHHEVGVTPREFADGLAGCVWAMDEPMADAASIPLYYVARLAREHVTVILSGEGSDELLGGYMTASDFRGFRRAQWVRRVPRLIRERMLRPLNQRWLNSERVSRYLALAELPPSHYPLLVPIYMGPVFSEEAKGELYGSTARETVRLVPSDELVRAAYRRTTAFEFLDQMLYVYTKQWLPEDLLLKADKMTMAHSLELRVPFLDYPLVKFVASLPVELKMRRNGHPRYTAKYVLRRAFEGRMPPEILHRPKRGFPVPLPSLFRDGLATVARDVFESRRIRESGIFETEKLLALLEQHQAGQDRSAQLWCLLVFCVWFDLFNVTR